jgi:DNA-binding PadR family transcriptional regulator
MTEQTLTDAELVILSLICEGPMHGYQIEGQITQRNMLAWTDLSTSSIYYLLGKLEEKGYIEQLQEEPGKRPERPRKVYQITQYGMSAWKSATIQALMQPKTTYTNFLLGLHNLWNIPPGEALEAVMVYRDWLEMDLQRQRDELENLGMTFFPLDVLFDYGFVLGDAELSFLANLITRLDELDREAQNKKKTGPNQKTEEETKS